MFAILLFFSFRDGSVLEFQAGLFKTHFSVGVGGGSQIGHRWVTSRKHHLGLVNDELQALQKTTVT